MEINQYFTEQYKLIDKFNNDVIQDFLEDIEICEEKKYFEPLKEIYLHETQNEMFLILDCLNLSYEDIRKVCNEWEDRVLGFVNFGEKLRENINYLKYNISLIILVKDKLISVNNDIKFEEEKSIKVCRKIFILCDDNGKIKESDKVILPFYFEPIKEVNGDTINSLENKLYNLLPKDVDIQEIVRKDVLEADDIEKLYRWVDKNENNKN